MKERENVPLLKWGGHGSTSAVAFMVSNNQIMFKYLKNNASRFVKGGGDVLV